jgi:voltage-gated potassium channel Kch
MTPLVFIARDKGFAALAARGGRREFDHIDETDSRVIIAGFGRYGQIIARLLRAKRIRFTALEISPAQVDFVRRFGNKIYYGDASRVDLLRAAKADEARIFVLAIDDPEASVQVASTVRHHFPHLEIIARARNRQHALALMAMGIEVVTRETLHSSLLSARRVLETLGLTAMDAQETVRKFQEIDEDALLKQLELRDDEAALIENAKKVASDLEKLFEQDASATR